MENYRLAGAEVQLSPALPLSPSTRVAPQDLAKLLGYDSDETVPGVIRVSQNAAVKTLVSNILAQLADPAQAGITLVGKGKEINKTVTVAEIAKRKITRTTLAQHTDILSLDRVEVWEPKTAELQLDKYRIKGDLA